MAMHPWMCSLALPVRVELFVPTGLAVKWSSDPSAQSWADAYAAQGCVCLRAPTCLGLENSHVLYHVPYVICIHAEESSCRKRINYISQDSSVV